MHAQQPSSTTTRHDSDSTDRLPTRGVARLLRRRYLELQKSLKNRSPMALLCRMVLSGMDDEPPHLVMLGPDRRQQQVWRHAGYSVIRHARRLGACSRCE